MLYHQKTAKYCLKIQGKESKLFKCEFCQNTLSTKQHYNEHILVCKNKKDDDIKKMKEKCENFGLLEIKIIEKDQKIKELQEQVEKLQNELANIAKTAASKPTHIQNNNQRINNTINNLIPITDDHFKDQVQYLTLDHIKNGTNGYVQYALEFPLKDRITCTDFSRRKIKYKDSEGNLVDDPEMSKLSQKFFRAIEEKNSILINEYLSEIQNQFNILNSNPNNEMNDDETKDFDIRSDALIEEVFKAKAQKREISEAANGKKPDIYHEFVKDICSKTVN
jgi:hypothetical protein